MTFQLCRCDDVGMYVALRTSWFLLSSNNLVIRIYFEYNIIYEDIDYNKYNYHKTLPCVQTSSMKKIVFHARHFSPAHVRRPILHEHSHVMQAHV